MTEELDMTSWLMRSARQVQAAGPVATEDDWPEPPAIGELRLIEPTQPGAQGSRIGCVVAVGEETTKVALVSHDFLHLSDTDLRARPEESGLPFSVQIQAGVVAPVWNYQIRRCIGRLGDELGRIVARACMGEPFLVPDDRRGLPITERRSLRWRAKASEIHALKSLSEDCRTKLHRRAGATGRSAQVPIDSIPPPESAHPEPLLETSSGLSERRSDRSRLWIGWLLALLLGLALGALLRPVPKVDPNDPIVLLDFQQKSASTESSLSIHLPSNVLQVQWIAPIGESPPADRVELLDENGSKVYSSELQISVVASARQPIRALRFSIPRDLLDLGDYQLRLYRKDSLVFATGVTFNLPI